MTPSATAAADLQSASIPGVVTVDAWQHLPWVRAGFSTRQGGHTIAYSQGDAHEQNLGWTPEDSASTVAENRLQFVRSFDGFSTDDVVTVRQIHGSIVCLVERGAPLQTPEGKAVLTGDGLMTIQPGILLGVQTADCVPVLLVDKRTRAVAALHAGWRGTVARIVEHGVDSMRREFGSQPEDLIAAIGPAIGPCCFAVGPEVCDQFKTQFVYADELVSEISRPAADPPQIHLDIWEANRRQLLAAGLAADDITVIGECTACATHNGRRKYFSHRAERGYTGRMLSVIGVSNS